MMRVIAGFLILFLSTLLSPLMLLPLVMLHALAWFGWELLIIGALIDSYFGVVHTVPWYTLTAVVLVVLAEWLKPHLTFYAE